MSNYVDHLTTAAIPYDEAAIRDRARQQERAVRASARKEAAAKRAEAKAIAWAEQKLKNEQDRSVQIVQNMKGILSAAANEARQHGLAHITRSGIAARAGVPSGSLSHYCSGASLADIKRAVAEQHPDLSVPELDRYQVDRAARDERILQAAYDEALLHGWQNIRRAALAHRTGMSAGSISNYRCQPGYAARSFPTMDTLRADVMCRAVERECLALLQQGLAAGAPEALAAPAELRERALRGAVG